MKFRLLTCLLAAAASAGRAEDCPLLVNQRFQLHFNQWQSNQGPTTTTSQAVYEVEASVPVITYRLGALVLNGAVLVPIYNDPSDTLALEVVGHAFPGRKIIGIDASLLIRQHGSLHCVTMQFPKGTLGH